MYVFYVHAYICPVSAVLAEVVFTVYTVVHARRVRHHRVNVRHAWMSCTWSSCMHAVLNRLKFGVLARRPSCTHVNASTCRQDEQTWSSICINLSLVAYERLHIWQKLCELVVLHPQKTMEATGSVTDPCPWFWIYIYRNGHVKISWLIDCKNEFIW